jgi:hypothetical protein
VTSETTGSCTNVLNNLASFALLFSVGITKILKFVSRLKAAVFCVYNCKTSLLTFLALSSLWMFLFILDFCDDLVFASDTLHCITLRRTLFARFLPRPLVACSFLSFVLSSAISQSYHSLHSSNLLHFPFQTLITSTPSQRERERDSGQETAPAFIACSDSSFCPNTLRTLINVCTLLRPDVTIVDRASGFYLSGQSRF